jgi:4-amino-4-deoxy-L-arabinose transferase-like glycosyltransferase
MSRQRVFLLLILGLYLLLALGYGALNPLFEAPDEHWHYFTAQTIRETGRLPQVADDPDPWTAQEAAQPPLYYVLGAAVLTPFDTAEARELIWPNPAVQLGDAGSPTNINAFVHGPSEAWPWRGYALGAHALRAMSAIFGLGTLLFIYGSALLVWPKAPTRALLAMAMIAFLPQFAFLHGSITNDVLIAFFTAAALWQLLRIWYGKASSGRLLWLGLTIGLAILSKTAGLLLLLYACGFLTLLFWRDSQREDSRVSPKSWLIDLGKVVIPALLLGGWLLWRNWQLYGDVTATSQILRFFGGDRAYTLGQVLGESSGLWISLFAVFGWFNVRPPEWVQIVWNGIVLVALLGVVLATIRSMMQPERRQELKETLLRGPWGWINRPGFVALLMGLWVLLVYAGLIRFMLQIHAGQGRLLFPALLPLALGLAYGLTRFRWRGIYVAAPLLALTTSLYSLLVVIPAAYALPPTITETQIPLQASRLDSDLGHGLELVAAEIETEVVGPEGWLWMTLYWRADPVPEGESPEYVLELLGQEDALAGKLQSYHGGGLYPAGLWLAGDVIVDRLAVQLDPEIDLPAMLRPNVKLVGEEASVDVGFVKAAPVTWPEMTDAILARLGDIELVSAGLATSTAGPGEEVAVELRWQVIEAPGRDLTTFVHLGDPAEPPLAQGDSPPIGGDYPTRLWAAGEVIDDSYRLTIPADLSPGRYPVHLGLYDPNTGERLPLIVEDTRQPNDAFFLGWLSVTS